MARGRRAQSPEVKALKGNPGKRKLALDGGGKAGAARTAAPIAMPEFLTHEREKTIFTRVVDDYLQRRIARGVDLIAYGRWAAYVHGWWSCKEFLEGKSRYYKISSNHGERLAAHPMWKDQVVFEKMLQSLEDRLGLNPAARQNILRGLAAMPAALGGFFGDEPQDKPASDIPDAPPPEEEVPSPLGFLQGAGKMH